LGAFLEKVWDAGLKGHHARMRPSKEARGVWNRGERGGVGLGEKGGTNGRSARIDLGYPAKTKPFLEGKGGSKVESGNCQEKEKKETTAWTLLSNFERQQERGLEKESGGQKGRK